MLVLHHLDRSPFSWKVRLVLAEKGVPHEAVVPKDKATDPAFARLNPLKLTPVLQLDAERTVCESTIINEYLEEAFPTPSLLPGDAWERARVRLIEDTADQYLYPAIRALAVARFNFQPPLLVPRPPAEVDAVVVEEARARVLAQMERFEAALEGRTWFGGSAFSLADAALVPAFTGSVPLHGLLPSDAFPRIAAWAARVRERPSFAASAPRDPWRVQAG